MSPDTGGWHLRSPPFGVAAEHRMVLLVGKHLHAYISRKSPFLFWPAALSSGDKAMRVRAVQIHEARKNPHVDIGRGAVG